jgi:hypothetical protein
MMHSPVNAQSIRVLAKSLREDVAPEIKHQQMLEIISRALGWSSSALLNVLKNEVGQSQQRPTSNVDARILFKFMVRQKGAASYLIAKDWRVEAGIEGLIRAVALYRYEPNAALVLAKRVFEQDPKLAVACVCWPGGGSGLVDVANVFTEPKGDSDGQRALVYELAKIELESKVSLANQALGIAKVALLVASLKVNRPDVASFRDAK